MIIKSNSVIEQSFVAGDGASEVDLYPRTAGTGGWGGEGEEGGWEEGDGGILTA